jgi:hypothetical protein
VKLREALEGLPSENQLMQAWQRPAASSFAAALRDPRQLAARAWCSVPVPPHVSKT